MAFAPVCKFPERDYGIGPTGLGTPVANTSSSGSGTSVIHFGAGNIPGYFATGQWLVDLSDEKGETIPPGTTISTLNSPGSGDVTLSANLTTSEPAGHIFATFNDIGSVSPTGWSKDVGNQILSCSTASPSSSLSGIAFLDWQIDMNSGCSNFNITNFYLALGTVKQRGQIHDNNATGTNTISNAWVNQRGLAINVGATGQETISAASGTLTITYTRLSRSWWDCFDGGTSSGTTVMTVKFSSCIDNDQAGSNPSVHSDVFQNTAIGGAGTIMTPTFQHSTIILSGDGTDTTQGLGCGDAQDTGNCQNQVFTDNLMYTNQPQPNYWCIGAPDLGTATCTNNFALPAATAFARPGDFTGVNAVLSGNINMATGAACTNSNNC
jgi:hypothetical protein